MRRPCGILFPLLSVNRPSHEDPMRKTLSDGDVVGGGDFQECVPAANVPPGGLFLTGSFFFPGSASGTFKGMEMNPQ